MTRINGQPATAEQLEGLALSSYGSYTFFQVRQRRVRGLHLHLGRLVDNGLELFGRAPSGDTIRQQVAAAVGDEPCSVRVTLAAPDHAALLRGDLVLPDVVVTTSPPREEDAPPLTVCTAHYERETPHVKHRATYGLARQTRLARHAGYDDALLVDALGQVSEGTTWNLLLHDGESWVWPQAPMLPGVTAALLCQAMVAHGAPHRTATVSVSQLGTHVAAFALNATSIRPITAIDDQLMSHNAAVAGKLVTLWRSVPRDPLDADPAG